VHHEQGDLTGLYVRSHGDISPLPCMNVIRFRCKLYCDTWANVPLGRSSVPFPSPTFRLVRRYPTSSVVLSVWPSNRPVLVLARPFATCMLRAYYSPLNDCLSRPNISSSCSPLYLLYHVSSLLFIASHSALIIGPCFLPSTLLWGFAGS
jgi:hypothetical protein